jgi:hypothetical protein
MQRITRLLGDWVEKLIRFHAEAARKFDDVEQRDVAFAALDAADIVAVEIGKFGRVGHPLI